MTDLANRDGVGECVLSRRDGHLEVTRADPRIMITLDLLDQIICGEEPGMTFRLRDDVDIARPGWALGAVIRIETANRTVLYQLTGKVMDTGRENWCLGYIAEWPD